MKPTRTLLSLASALALGLALSACQPDAPAPEADPVTDPATEATTALHRLFDDAWERRLQENPVFASNLGDLRWNDQWGDRSLEAIEGSHQATVLEYDRLRRIDRDALPADEQLNYDLFAQQLEDDIEHFQYRTFLMPVGHRGGLQTLYTMTESLRLDTVEHHEDWLARLSQVDTLVDQTIALMTLGIEEDRVPPRVIMERVPAQIETNLVDDPADSPYFAAFERFPDAIPAVERDRLRSEALAVIEDVVTPAMRRFHDFFTGEYLPATRETVGAWALPDGRDYYAYRARSFTTTDLTPDEIHRIGLDEVERIRAQMYEVIDEVGFEGGFDEFLTWLRTDPKFYYDTPEELLEAYRAMGKVIDPLMVRLFGKLPRIPYGIRPIPDAVAPDTTTAFYRRPAADGTRAGYYYVNLYRPEVRPKYEMMALSLHEAVPGHHLQIALQMELGDLPMFRRYGGFTAFSEGWGLYAEYLGEELGLYEDPFDKFGQLTYEMWRAVRLVVDTGIHHKEWSRERAIEFFAANAAKTEADIVNEIDRYIGRPGQALAYKIGELKIRELRTRAEEALGGDFDVRAFHDAVLEQGAVPLNILERHIDTWIEARL